MEADGEWHTSDNKYGSIAWKASHPALAAPARKPPSTSQPSSRSPSKPSNTDANGKSKANNREIFVLDSDDEDEGQVKRELSPSFASGSQSFGASVPQTQASAAPDDVIDLTLDSDDDEPPPRQTGKRKATDSEAPSTSPTEQIWKKSRMEAVPFRGSSSNAGDDSSASQPNVSRTTVPPLRFISTYQNTSDYPSYSAGGASTTNSRLPLPSINAILPRTNGRWA